MNTNIENKTNFAERQVQDQHGSTRDQTSRRRRIGRNSHCRGCSSDGERGRFGTHTRERKDGSAPVTDVTSALPDSP